MIRVFFFSGSGVRNEQPPFISENIVLSDDHNWRRL